MMGFFNYNEETHTNKSMPQCQVVSLANRPEKLSKEADLKDWNIQALHQHLQVSKLSHKKFISFANLEDLESILSFFFFRFNFEFLLKYNMKYTNFMLRNFEVHAPSP